VIKWKERRFAEDGLTELKIICLLVLSPQEEAIIVAFRKQTFLLE